MWVRDAYVLWKICGYILLLQYTSQSVMIFSLCVSVCIFNRLLKVVASTIGEWSYLFVCAFECEEHVDHVAGDENHGGEGHAPADPLTPGREHVVTHGEGNHLHCTEQEDPLCKQGTKGKKTLGSSFWMQSKL